MAKGMEVTVRDWDLTIDAESESVVAVLNANGVAWKTAADRSGLYSTRDRFVATLLTENGAHDIDIMVRFAIRPDATSTPIAIETVECGVWNGIPLGSLENWLVAYRLMQRPLKPELIAAYLRVHGGDVRLLDRLLAGPLPLPSSIQDELTVLRAISAVR